MVVSTKFTIFACRIELKRTWRMKKMMEITNINPQFAEGLYGSGEHKALTIDYSDDDIIIVDNIRDIVAANPMRVKMNGIIVCFNGTIQVDVNNQRRIFGKNQLVMFPPNTTIDNYLFSVDFECKAIFLTNHIIQRFLRPYVDIWNHVMYVKKIQERQLSDIDLEFVCKIYDVIRFCLDYGEDTNKKEVVQSFIQGALMGLGGMLLRENDYKDLPKGKNQSGDIFPRFLDLLQNSQVKHRQVTDYADQLCVTPKYLTIVCKQHSGKTALQWIEEYTLADIDYYLRSTNHSIKEIANILGFPNASFFGKFVKEHLGLPPMSYRKRRKEMD